MGKKKYLVTLTRYGFVWVEAENEGEAMDIANHQKTDSVGWSDDWEPTDVVEDDSQPDGCYVTDPEF